jgi:hypothetical protein
MPFSMGKISGPVNPKRLVIVSEYSRGLKAMKTQRTAIPAIRVRLLAQQQLNMRNAP